MARSKVGSATSAACTLTFLQSHGQRVGRLGDAQANAMLAGERMQGPTAIGIQAAWLG